MGKRSFIVRFSEMLPGLLTWLTFLGAPLLAYFHPVWVSLYIILFDLYWFLKGANVAIHLIYSYRTLKVHDRIDWLDWAKRLKYLPAFKEYLQTLAEFADNRKFKSLYRLELARVGLLPAERPLDWEKLYHLVIFPTYKEDIELLRASIESYLKCDYPKDKILFVLGLEERAGVEALERARMLTAQFSSSFGLFMTSLHPDNLPGEVRGKAGNMNESVRAVRVELDKRGIAYEDVIVSTFDCDTVVQSNYFAHLTYDFLTEVDPLRVSYQPMPVYHNNIWDTPAVARVIAVSSSFWQLIEASRPDRLVTFASHAMSFQTLIDVGLFRKDSINEDSFIFWQCFMHFNGDYRTKPLFTTVSMDAVMGSTYWETCVAQYKQKRRWAYGVAQISYVVDSFIKNKAIPLWKRLLYAERMIEGHYFWATASIMIAILGWLPLIFGGSRFGTTVLALNLPILTRGIMTIATFFLIFSVYISLVMLPPKPKGYSRWKNFSMVWQWVLAPIVASVFGSLPAVDAQTRLMLGIYYREFYITPKFRKGKII